MINIYKTNPKTGITSKIDKLERNSWINVINPTEEEIKRLSEKLNIEEFDLNSFLDEEEQARTEVEDNYNLIVLDIPSIEKHDTYNLNITIPLIILQVSDEYIK